KSICVPPYGKNLKNRFGDLCTEAITLHMRFPYSVVCGLFTMPEDANVDRTPQRKISTFQRASMLFGTISGRANYESPGERFEDITMMLFRPLRDDDIEPWVRLYAATSRPELREVGETEYFAGIRDVYNVRNPHAQVGLPDLETEADDAL